MTLEMAIRTGRSSPCVATVWTRRSFDRPGISVDGRPEEFRDCWIASAGDGWADSATGGGFVNGNTVERCLDVWMSSCSHAR